VRGCYLSARLARSVYAVALDASGALDPQATSGLRAAAVRARREESIRVEHWLAAERGRLADAESGELIEPVRRMYAESMRLSPAWADQFRDFWNLPDDFSFDVPTPTVEISRTLLAGADPDDLQRQPRTDVVEQLPEVGPATTFAEPVTEEALESLIDGELPDSQVRQLQSGYKDAQRFDTWLAVSQRRWPFPEDRVLLPLGLHLAIVELPEGARVIRSDSGHIFGDWRENWKLGAYIRVRRTKEDLGEIYPDKMAPDPEWNELREYLDPVSMTLLDVESVPPGYPIVHDFLPDLEGFYRHWLGRPLDEARR
jgi:acetone carboxylase, gamma subunit